MFFAACATMISACSVLIQWLSYRRQHPRQIADKDRARLARVRAKIQKLDALCGECGVEPVDDGSD